MSDMKKFLMIVFAFAMVLTFASCGTGNSQGITQAQSTTKAETTQPKNVELTVGKAVLAKPEEFLQSMEAYGAEIEENDESQDYVLVFSEDEYKKLIQDKHDETVEKFRSFEEDADSCIDTIEYTENFRELKICVDKEKYENNDGANDSISVAAAALSYQLYLNEEQKTAVNVVCSGTEEVVASYTLPVSLSAE